MIIEARLVPPRSLEDLARDGHTVVFHPDDSFIQERKKVKPEPPCKSNPSPVLDASAIRRAR